MLFVIVSNKTNLKGNIIMTFKSKRTIATLIAGIILIIVYIIYATGKFAPAPEDLKSWAVTMLIFIGIGIAAVIIIQILFHIVFAIGLAAKERAQGRSPDQNVERELSSEMIKDEMEKQIALKAGNIGHWFAGLGVIALLVALASGISFVLALHIVVGAFVFSGIAEGIASIYLYEKGV